jgi:hypothetical protein
MTILVSALCEDGLVIGADSMASLNLGNTNFVGVDNNKITTIDNTLIIACAGDDNLMSKFINFLNISYNSIREECKNDKDIYSLPQKIGLQFAHYLVNHLQQMPTLLNQQILNKIATEGFNFSAILGFTLNDNNHYLCKYDNRLIPTIIRNDGIWHIIQGSGQLVAEPSMHLVKKLLNIKRKPTVNEASTLVYWTIQHAIEVSSGGIGGDIKIKILKKDNNIYTITDGDIVEHKIAIDGLYTHIHQYKFNLTDSKDIPQL